MKKAIIGSLLVIAGLSYAVWAQVGPTLNHCRFQWDQPAGGQLAGFNIYLRNSPTDTYAQVGVVTGNTPGHYAPSTDFCAAQSSGQKYAIVKAFDTAGQESGASNEVPFVFDPTVLGNATNLQVR